jgi:NADH-quinone oxidoreductase subunit G
VLTFEQVLEELAAGTIQALLLTAGYPRPWLAAGEVERLARCPLLVVVDLLASEVCERAHYVLPSAAWAEKDGAYVNHAGLLQRTERAVRPPGSARAEGRIVWELAGRPRLYVADDVRQELAADVPYFAACRDGNVPEHGLRLA